MAFISYVKASEAGSRLKKLYEKFRSPRGDIDHILKIHSLNPASMQAHYDLYKTLMFRKSDLSRLQREMIAVVVSRINKCFY